MAFNSDPMRKLVEFLELLDRYAQGPLEVEEIGRFIQEHGAAPGFAGRMIEAVQAAEQAGELSRQQATELCDRIRLLKVDQPMRSPASQGADEQTRVRVQRAGDCHADTFDPAIEGEPAPAAVGMILKNRYLLEEQIGEGGMGTVFRARDLEEERIAHESGMGGRGRHFLAIKVLRVDRGAFRGDAIREMQNTRDLVHENIVSVKDCQLDGDLLFMTMEYLEGRTLDSHLGDRFVQGFKDDRVWAIIKGIGKGLEFAHDRGLVHCDLKPSNIFITYDFSPKILDFGIARAVRPGRRSSGAAIGITPRYASPEMLEAIGKKVWDYRPDRRDDMFALGCVVYEMLTGSHPFGDRNPLDAKRDGVDAHSIPRLSPKQNRALARALAFDREKRPERVDEFISEILPASAMSQDSPRIAPVIRPPRARVTAVLAVVTFTMAMAYAYWQIHRSRAEDSLTAHKAGEFRDCAECPAMVVIPAGKFMMGSSPAEQGHADDERPRPVTVPAAFALSVYPVTLRQYRAFVAATERRPSASCVDASNLPGINAVDFSHPGFEQSEDDPVVCVTADDARAYAEWVNRLSHLEAYRLPTEAEWEYAARGGTASPYPWGDNELHACDYGNFGDRSLSASEGTTGQGATSCNDGFRFTSPVFAFSKTKWGLADAVGNVQVWTEACTQSDEQNLRSDTWLNGCRRYRVVRGAGFATRLGGASVRIARRTVPPPSVQATNAWGFRLARSL